MLPSFFVSDLHGRTDRYRTLFELVRREVPRGVFFGGDLLPHGMDLKWRTSPDQADFLEDYLLPEFRRLEADLGDRARG